MSDNRTRRLSNAPRAADTIAALAILALTAGATIASADRGVGHGGKGAAERLFTLQPDPAGNPEGIAFDRRSRSFFVGITADGAIYRGTLGRDTLTPFIPGAAGKAAIGLKVRRGKLYVAGGPTGAITVYDLATKQPVATFQIGAGGFLNDLVVTRRGDVFVTDSFRPTLWRGAREARLADTRTSDKLRGPSTVDVAKRLYLVVNADFATSQTPFTVAGLPRRSRHGHHGH